MTSKGVPVYEGDGANEGILIDQTYRLMLETYPDLYTTDAAKAFMKEQIKAILTGIASTRQAEVDEARQKKLEEEKRAKEEKRQEALGQAGARLGKGQKLGELLGNNSIFAELGIPEERIIDVDGA